MAENNATYQTINTGFNGTDIQVFIQNEQNKVFLPVICEDISLEWERQGTAGKLTFSLVNDDILSFSEGNIVKLGINGQEPFLGFVFAKARDKDGIVSVTAYDQLRYFKNKEIKNYTNKRADEVIKEIAEDFNLKIGELANTGYVIPKRRDSNQTLFDIALAAIQDTLVNTGERFILYDDFGKLMLKNAQDMFVPILIDAETAENYDYQSSIDSDSFNKIKLYYDNKDSGKREIYIEQDGANMAKWGTLQYCESLNEQQARNAVERAKQALRQYNKVSRSLNKKNAFGDIRVRGGSYLAIKLNLGDIELEQNMLIDKVKHKFNNNEHLMDLKVNGGVING